MPQSFCHLPLPSSLPFADGMNHGSGSQFCLIQIGRTSREDGVSKHVALSNTELGLGTVLSASDAQAFGMLRIFLDNFLHKQESRTF